MTGTIDYAVAGPMTTMNPAHRAALDQIPNDPVGICQLARHLVVQPTDTKELGLAEERFTENHLRPVDRIIGALLALDPAPLTVARSCDRRVIGTCRHFAVLSCALLRYRGIAARARCGFATYFQPGQGLDHWITEYRHDGRWVRVDSEILGASHVVRPEDLAAGEFLTGGEAWTALRAGRIDAARFGVYGTENFGPAEIRGNAVRDLAALNKIEMLPWMSGAGWTPPTRAGQAQNTTGSSTRSRTYAPPTIVAPSRTFTPARISRYRLLCCGDSAPAVSAPSRPAP